MGVNEEQRRTTEEELDCAVNSSSTTVKIVRLATTSAMATKLDPFVKNYNQARADGFQVKLISLNSPLDLENEIVLDARLKTKLYDGFVAPYTALGTMIANSGLLELTSMIQENDENMDWNDILPFYRQVTATYDDDRIFLVPLEGKVMHLFYNSTIINEKKVPKSWEEYTTLAKSVGSCLGLGWKGRCDDCPIVSIVDAILASITQIDGTASGHLFYPENTHNSTLTSLLQNNEVLSTLYSLLDPLVVDDRSDLSVYTYKTLNQRFLEGKCGLAVSSIDLLNQAVETFSNSTDMLQNIGAAQLPGSYTVLDRSNNSVTWLNKSTPNRAAAMMYGTYYGGISFNALAENQEIVFNLLASLSKEFQSNYAPGAEPFRYSQINTAWTNWTDTGFDAVMVSNYMSNVNNFGGQDKMIETNQNNAVGLRIPEYRMFLSELDDKVYSYLSGGDYNQMTQTSNTQDIVSEWNKIVNTYDSSSPVPLQIIYDQSLGVYDIITGDKNFISEPVRIASWGLSSIGILTSIAFAIWTIKNWSHRVVKASQPLFLIMICVGTMVMALSIIPMSFDDNLSFLNQNVYKNGHVQTGATGPLGLDVACMAVPWLYSVGFVVVFSALFSKTWRVNKIFHNRDVYKRLKVTIIDVMGPFLILFTLNAAVLAAWTVVAPLKWHRSIKSTSTLGIELLQLSEPDTFGVCLGSDDGGTYLIFGALLAAVDICAVMFANFQAYQSRNIAMEYSESQWIFIAMVCILQVWLIGIPLMILVVEDPSAQLFVRSGIVFVTCMSANLLMFIPKIKYVRDYERKRAKEQAEKRARQQATSLTFSSEGDQVGDHAGKRGSASSTASDPHGHGVSSRDSVVADGLKILTHPMEEDPQVALLKTQIAKAEEERVRLQKELEDMRKERGLFDPDDPKAVAAARLESANKAVAGGAVLEQHASPAEEKEDQQA